MVAISRAGFARRGITLLGVAAVLAVAATPAYADKIANRVAVFAFLDKVTARISKMTIPLNKTVAFGSLKVTARACYSRPLTEEPKTTSFVEVDDLKLDGTVERIFSGWMLAQSPGLHAVEHPVYDVWLTDCQKPSGAPVPVAVVQPADANAAPADAAAAAADPQAADQPAADAQAGDAAASEAQPGDAPAPAPLPLKKHHVKRQ